jgi:hypothetical protein
MQVERQRSIQLPGRPQHASREHGQKIVRQPQVTAEFLMRRPHLFQRRRIVKGQRGLLPSRWRARFFPVLTGEKALPHLRSAGPHGLGHPQHRSFFTAEKAISIEEMKNAKSRHAAALGRLSEVSASVSFLG